MFDDKDKVNAEGVKRGTFVLLTNTCCEKLILQPSELNKPTIVYASVISYLIVFPTNFDPTREVKDLLVAHRAGDAPVITKFAILAKAGDNLEAKVHA